nr:Chain A, Dicer Related Helicase [Caenorhabditis elegans]6M6Q_B Chain B, Dicer Related Helicase [Caenorhabditis elegans]
MQPTAIRLEDYDKSKLRLPFESPYFPAYFRLLKWKFLDVCVESTRNNDIGYFKLFESLFPPGKLEEIARMIIDEPTPVSHDPDMIKIRNADLDVKIRKQAETYVTLRHAHQQKVQRRRFSECFLNTVLFDEKGLRIADEVMFNYDKELYGYSHWEDLPDGWLTAETFKNKFYDEEEVTNNPFGYQKLDRVAGAARGMIIMKHLKSNPRCVSETTILAFEVFNKGNHQLSTDLVEDLLTEGPAFELKIENGEEKKYAVKKWSLHKTLTMFLAIIGFKSNDKKEKNEHEEWYYGFIDAMKNDPANRAALYFLDKNWPEELEEREKERDRIRLTLLKS